jgi:hypothetical protein
MYTTRRFWVEAKDYVYVQHAAKCFLEALMDDTFREEFYFAFSSIDVEYSKVTMMNDNFYYSFDYDGLNRKLELLLRNTQYFYTKGSIMENVIRTSEILDLGSDIYIITRHDNPEPTHQLRNLFSSIINRCVNRYLELGMLRYRLHATVYYDGSLKYLKSTYWNRTDANEVNYGRYSHENYHTMDRYCLLSDIVDVRGHININLEKTASLLKKRLSTEVIADFGSTDDFGGSATASVLVTRSGHAYGIREDKVRNSSSGDIRLAYEDVKDDSASDKNIDSVDNDDNDEESYVSENTRLAEDTARERRLRALGGDEADSGTDSMVEDVYEVDGDNRVYNVNMYMYNMLLNVLWTR